MANTYRIKTAHGDNHFEVEGDKTFVLEMLKKFNILTPVENQKNQNERKSPKKNLETIKPPIDAKKQSVGEFIRHFNFKKHTDFVLSFGYYLEKLSGLSEFTPADINNCYYEAKMESSNTSQMIIQNIKRGLMMGAKGDKDKKKKYYTLTSSGVKHIEGHFQDN